MAPLWKKLWRDLKTNLGQFLAVVIVSTLGSAFFISSFSSYQGVAASLDQTYKEQSFARYWINLDGQRPAVLPPGVEARETAQITLEFKQGERVGARLIGLPPGGPAVNKLKLASGAMPGEGQVLVEVSFAKFHGIKLGDTLGIRLGEKIYNWVVSGTAGSPEFIWPVIDRFVPNPSPRSFGVLFVPEKQLIRDITGLNHELLVTADDPREVMTQLQSENAKVREIYSRAEQPSNQVLGLMIKGFGKVTGVLPWLFLLAAALSSFALTNILVNSQTEQIKILKYLGFSHWQVLTHYLSFSLLAAVCGSLLGVLLGVLLAGKLTGALVGILGLPFVVSVVNNEVVLTAVISSCFASVLGALIPALQITHSNEKVMRETPNWSRFIPVMIRIPLNNLLRDARSSLFGAAVIGLGVCLMVVGYVMYQSVENSAQKQFSQYQAYDLRVKFNSALKEEVTAEIAQIPGVLDVNPYYELSVLVKAGRQQVPTELVGTRGDMLRLEDRLGRPVQLSGLFISDGVKKSLGASWTPDIDITALGGRKGQLPLKGYVRWHFGNQIFAPLEMAQTLSGKKGLNGVYLRVQPEVVEQVKARLYRYPTVVFVDSPQENQRDQTSLVSFTNVYLRILTIFGLILASAIIFALARVKVLSRSWEYTTMRILGVSLSRIGLSVITEYLILLLFGLALGILSGIGLAYYLLSRVNTLLSYNLLSVEPNTLLIIALISLFIVPAAVASAILAVKKLSLTENTREQN